jgi:hypothetical protein
MGIEVSWDSGAVCLTYIGHWTWEEHHAAVQALDDLSAESERLVDVIVDLTQSGPLPEHAIPHLGQTLRGKHPQWSKRAIMVSQGRVAQLIMEMVLRVYYFAVYDREIRFVSTLEEARALLIREVELT